MFRSFLLLLFIGLFLFLFISVIVYGCLLAFFLAVLERVTDAPEKADVITDILDMDLPEEETVAKIEGLV